MSGLEELLIYYIIPFGTLFILFKLILIDYKNKKKDKNFNIYIYTEGKNNND